MLNLLNELHGVLKAVLFLQLLDLGLAVLDEGGSVNRSAAVSYTHLDVYKRQVLLYGNRNAASALILCGSLQTLHGTVQRDLALVILDVYKRQEVEVNSASWNGVTHRCCAAIGSIRSNAPTRSTAANPAIMT